MASRMVLMIVLMFWILAAYGSIRLAKSGKLQGKSRPSQADKNQRATNQNVTFSNLANPNSVVENFVRTLIVCTL